jgi:hypothetical protein
MELLLNELSLSGQFESVDQFVEKGVLNILGVFAELQEEDKVLKKYDFYSYRVTSSESIHDVLAGSLSRTYDELRRFKIHIAKFFDEPYWEKSQRHDASLEYSFQAKAVSNTSLAEACERDRIIISFIHEDFKNSPISVSRSTEDIAIDNLFEDGHYTTVLHARGLLTVFSLKNRTQFTRTSLFRQGKPVYRELATGNYWYLDNLHKNHFEVFDANEDHLGIADLKGNLDTTKSVKGRKL